MWTTFATLEEPLELVVPGFTDTITLLATPQDVFRVVRWDSGSETTQTVLSIHRTSELGLHDPVGLDASGRFFAEIGAGLLMVHRAEVPRGEPEVLDARVFSAVWHHEDPGLLAWLACSRDGAVALRVLDVGSSSDPVQLQSFRIPCGEPGLEHWTYGALAVSWPDGEYLVFDAGGDDVESFGDAVVAQHAGGGPVWVRYITDPGRQYVIDAGRATLLPIPGIGTSERAVATEWSPSGDALAVWLAGSDEDGAQPFRTGPDRPDEGEEESSEIRIVDRRGAVLARFTGVGLPADAAMAWSRDGRFFLYQDHGPATGVWELKIYDTESGGTVGISLLDVVDVIRTTRG